MRISAISVLFFTNLAFAVEYSTKARLSSTPSCEYHSNERKLVCGEIIDDPSFVQDVSESTELIVFTSGNLACDCTLKRFIEWRETLPRSRTLTLEGICFSPEHPSGISINDLSSKNILCGSGFESDVLVRKRRAVDGGQNETQPTANRTYSPGAPVLPCDFERGFCQWFQLVDDEFHWTRNKGPTNSSGTGPDVDHTLGTANGYYIYIEASLPRRPHHTARLVGPTLAAVELNSTCEMDLYIHMKGSTVGTLNIYQAPVRGFAIKKFSLSTSQAQNWFKRRIQFDSDTEFQVIIEGVRGNGYQGDIAIDDIKFKSGCKRLVPSYVRLTNGSYHVGRVEIYRQGAWGPVCQEGWSQEDSSVACREMGFAKTSPGGGGGSPLTGPFTGLYNVSCSGNETSIKNCPAGVWSNNTSCPSNYTATVDCLGILPVCPLKTHFYCPADSGGNKKCISHAQLCDFTKDCWDGSDELNCDSYTRCDFNDTGLCGWIQAQNDQMDWTRHNRGTPSIITGPSADHTGNPNAYYLYMEVSGHHGGEKARILVTPRFQGNNNGLCKVRFYYHMYGPGIGTLRVIAADRYSRHTLWSKTYSQNVDWTRAEVQLVNMSTSFIVTFEGEHRGYSPLGDIAIDDVSFTPECRPAPHENVTCKAGTLPCGTGECIPLSLQCDFNDDCFDGSDEQNCGLHTPGRCDFEADLCHWQNMTDDKFDWQRYSGSSPSVATGPMYDHTKGFGGNGYYLYMEASSPRVPGDIARLISPQFMWKNVANCTLRFYYHMQGLFWWSNRVGTLRVRLRNTITGAKSSPLWQRSGHQGYQWERADVAINTSWPVTQVIFEAERGSSYRGDIAIDDVSFSPECYPSEAVHIYKNYDVRLAEGTEGSFEGRVEVYRVGTWGTICDDGWGTNDANVVCKQLGYAGVKSVHPSSYFGEGKGQIWLDELACEGNETNLGQCMHNGWGSHDCTHSKDAGVVCEKDGGTTKAVRLRRNNETRSGQVEIYHSGSWEAICYDGWDVHDAYVACRQLGYFGADGIKSENPVSTPNALQNVQCNGNENTLGDCVRDWRLGSCSYGYAGVICSAQGSAEGNIRLSGGSSRKEGRIEVFHQGEWGTVCDDGWHLLNARVVCYELGFTSVRKVLQSFGPGSGRVWLNRVNCNGTETALVNCPDAGWGVTSCRHQEDVGVICSDDAYVGCYKDTNVHVMRHEFTAASMTPVKCIRRCQSRGYRYAGLEWANECHCGNHYDRYGNATSCDLPCLGDASKTCGGAWALSVYNTDPAIIPTTIPGHAAVTQSCTTSLSVHTGRYYGGDHRSGWISTPRFPSNYEDRTLCIWVLTLLTGTKVKISFKSFNTEENYDYVEIRDGEKDYSRPFLTPINGFSGSYHYSVTASSNVMWIKFYSDSSVNRQGFNLTYEALGAPTTVRPLTPIATTAIPPSRLPEFQFIEGGCNGRSDAVNQTFGYFDPYHNTGYVHSPGYPSNYDNNLVCRWSITVAPGFRIIATVKQADIANQGGLGDKLSVDDGKTTKFSNEHAVPWEFLSDGNLVRVLFITDAVNSGKGFYLSYEKVNITEGVSSTTSVPITTSIAQTSASTSQMASPVELTQTLTSTLTVTSSAIQPTSSSIRVPPSGERPTTPAVENTAEQNKGEEDRGMSAGTVAGIVVPILLLIIVVTALLAYCVAKKKKRNNQGVRHGFVNEAYGESMGMTPTVNNSSEYAQPAIANGTHARRQPLPGQDPSVYFAAAPPPYSQAPSGGVYLVPFAAAQGGGMVPVGVDNPAYAALYAAPPAYEATTRAAANGTTTTGIGSVTSLREAAKDVGVAAPANTVTPAAMFPPISRSVLPPIRGTNGATDQAKIQLPQGDEAGPLPEKPPLTVITPPEPTAPPRPPSASSQIRVVSPVSEPEQEFDTDVPFEFVCPITNKIMTDPVTAADGFTYERRAIRRWFRKKRSSPMTNAELSDLTVKTNDELRRRIEGFKGEHTVV